MQDLLTDFATLTEWAIALYAITSFVLYCCDRTSPPSLTAVEQGIATDLEQRLVTPLDKAIEVLGEPSTLDISIDETLALAWVAPKTEPVTRPRPRKTSKIS